VHRTQGAYEIAGKIPRLFQNRKSSKKSWLILPRKARFDQVRPRNETWFACYTELMLDELTFRRYADTALESLKKSLIAAEEGGEFEVEENSGALNVLFEEPPGKFVITPNTPVRQIWISALSTSYKLDWSDDLSDFVLPRDNISFRPLVARLINQHLGSDSVVLT
jgi:iron donor protein CyaY